jgi:hypothetical protein
MIHQIKVIVKTDRMRPHERISCLGGPGWMYTQDEVIEKIESGSDSFIVSDGCYSLDVVVAINMGIKYLKTKKDNLIPGKLLNLPCAA